MAIKKTGASTKPPVIKSADEIEFDPSRNGSYLITFSKENRKAGFKVLLKGGMFHRVPKGYVVYPEHKRLLEEDGVPFEVVRR